VNDVAINKTSALCNAVTRCKWDTTCKEDAVETVKLPKEKFAAAITAAVTLADPQCTAKKLKTDSTDEVVYATDAACVKNTKCKWDVSCKYKVA
jgi:hypothetical protein